MQLFLSQLLFEVSKKQNTFIQVGKGKKKKMAFKFTYYKYVWGAYFVSGSLSP